MKRPLLALPFAAALAGLLILLWWKRPTETATAPPAAPPVRPVHSGDPHEHPAETKGLEKTSTTDAPAGGLLVRVTGRGSPLPGAEVSLLREGTESRMKFQTGPDGTRLITQIPAGTYSAAVAHPRFLRGHAHLSISSGAKATADIDLKGGARIFGRVTDKAGNPLPHTNVSLVDGDNSFDAASHMSAKTDANGRYEIPPAGPGNYGLRFKHEQFKLLERLGLMVRTGSEELEVDAVLELGARVSGRVLDDSGAPLAGAQVLFGNDGSGGLARTDAEGRFTVYGLTEFSVSGSASLKGYGTVYRRGVPPNTLDLEFRLSKGGILAGRLLVDPLPEHFTVSLSRFDPELGRPLRFHQKAMSFPPQGNFLVEDVAAGTYWVEVESDGYETREQPQVTISSGQTTPGVTIRLQKK
jgi:protocatechuate 3,4-dioxygenase beta subunit